MATSSNFGTSNAYVFYNIEVTENGTDVNSNTSTITVVVRCWRSNSGYTTYGTGTCYVGINGVGYSRSISSDQKFTYNSYTEIFRETVSIPHNDDGTKTVWVSASITHQRFTSSDQGFNVGLTTIARKSDLGPIYGTTFGSNVQVNINRKSGSFTHTVVFAFGSSSQQVTGVGTVANFTPSPDTYGRYIPNGMSGVGSITVITYNGGTEIGRVSTSITMYLPDYTPTITAPVLKEATAGIEAKFGFYVQHKSTLSVEFGGGGVWGSSISSFRIEVNGATYSSSKCTTNVLNTAGQNTCKVTVTDSRGKSASTSKTFNVVAYEVPSISKFAVSRNQNIDTKLDCLFSASITPLENKNDRSIVITTSVSSGEKYKKTDAYSVTNDSASISGAESNKSYTVTLTVKDYFATIVQTLNIGTAFALMNFSADGKHIAIGQMYDESKPADLQIANSLMIGGIKVLWYE